MGMSIKAEAINYKEQTTKNISELDSVSVDAEVYFKTVNKTDGESFSYEFIVVDGTEYRMPVTVKKQLKQFLQMKPELKKFRVLKSGTGMQTEYMVVPLD